MSQFNSTSSNRPISFFNQNGGLVFLPPGVLTSSIFVTGSAVDDLANQTGSLIMEFVTESSAVQFRIPSESAAVSTDIIPIFITSSGINPRVGVGTTSPETVFDFKDIENSTVGTEILLRTARSTTTGAVAGDEGGSINFAIDSGSFSDIKTSGSLAKIKTKVTDIGLGGAKGTLVFELSKATSGESQDIFSYGFSQTGETDFNLFSQIQTASLLIKDFSAGGKSVIEMRDNSNNTKLKLSEGNITSSGNISASGDITCTNITVAGDITSVGDDVTIGDNLVFSSVSGQIQFHGDSSGGGNEGVLYKDSAGGNRFGLIFPGSDVVALVNRASDGTVEIRANSSTAGSSGEVIVTKFENDKITHNVASEIRLTKTSNTDADYNGDVVFFGGTTSMDAGKIYYFNSSGNWALADADAESSSDGLLAVALGAASDTNGMLIKGMVTLDHDPGTIGDPLFLSTTTGQASSTAPSATDDIVRLIGYCLDSTNGQIYFNPSNDFIKHA